MTASPSRPNVLVFAVVSVSWLAGLIASLFIARFTSDGAAALTVATVVLLPSLAAAAAFRVVVSGSGGPLLLASAAMFLGAAAVTLAAPFLPFPILVAPLATGLLALVAVRMLDRG